MQDVFLEFLKKNRKKARYFSGALLLVLFGWWLFSLDFGQHEKKVYEVAVWVQDQRNAGPEKDMKNSGKAGDVFSIKPEGHKWTRTEEAGYLILKLELSEEEKARLLQPERKSYFWFFESEDPDRPIVRARAYHIPLDQKEFAGFTPVNLLSGQPFREKVYDWSIVEKK